MHLMTIPSSTRGIHHFDLGDAQFGDLLDHGLGQRLEGARHHEALFRVHGVLDQHLVLEVFALLRLLDGEFLDVVEQLQDLLVGAPVLILAVLAFASPSRKASARKKVVVRNFRRRFLRSR